jgi:hypothetical protein
MNDIKKLTEYYRRPDGRVYYKEFVDLMENAFNIPELEKKPLTQVTRPGRGLLSKVWNKYILYQFIYLIVFSHLIQI